MAPKDADKTAFVTRRGMFRFKVLPFGFTNAVATFQLFHITGPATTKLLIPSVVVGRVVTPCEQTEGVSYRR